MYGDALYPETRLLDLPVLAAFDTLGDDSFSHDRDEILNQRSAIEFVRADLTPDQQAELDRVDEFWRAHATDFNKDFALVHAFSDMKTAMKGWIKDSRDQAPEIPRSHWWWWPIEIEGGE